ncbi:MAG TPA: hypothetical protein VMZ28_08980 [Kofleriaceae bacterium]|nr:hypothetical protein [Kofleriaceae bacterium]
MLSGRIALVFFGTLACATSARAEEDAIHVPERLTVGVADQFLGQLAPDGKRLYFVTNRNTVTEIYSQDIAAARATALFDEGADVTWPRVSPDGRRLLYVSFRDDAGGLLCVRDLPDGRRRCLSDGASAVQAQWIGNRRIALVSRTSLQGDLRVMDVTVGRKLTAKVLVARNLTSPTVSPDGRWLVYVPVERYVERVGPGFAARAAKRLEALRIDRPGNNATPLTVDLPGMTGQPAFSSDGRALYFAQFFNDSNHDGLIDGSDHAVLFRVPFEGDQDDAPALASRAFPRQLTDAGWNCQYPTPSPAQLIATCTRAKTLDIYALSLDGAVPGAWSVDRLRMEIDLSSRRPEQLLLYRHLLDRETEKTARRSVMLNLIQLHLELDESDAAEFYAAKIGADKDKATAGVASGLKVHLAHRRAIKARDRGRISIEFVDESRQRLASLVMDGRGSPTGIAFKHLVRSEIADSLGDKELALKELEAVVLDEVTLPPVLEAFHERADALYRGLDDAAGLVAALRRLVAHPALAPDDRARYARAAVRAMIRGLPSDESVAILGKERAAEPRDSEMAFALELAELLLTIRDDKPKKPVREAIVAFYRRQPRVDRKRAVMMDATQRATELGAEKLVEELVQLYVEDVPRGTQERRRVERLYERVMEGRAYRLLARDRLDPAREIFLKVAFATGSLESHIGYIDISLKQGRSPAELIAEYAKTDAHHSAPVAGFARAYLIARTLPTLDGAAHAAALKEALAQLKSAWNALKTKAPVRALFGAVLHEQFIQEGTLAAAQRADTHYLVALELVRKNPRYRALILEQLGLLHAQVGNWRISLGYLQERDKLPFAGDAAELAHRIFKARVLFHLDRVDEARAAAEEGLAAIGKKPALAEFRPLALGRTALYNLASGSWARALELYDEQLRLVDVATGPLPRRNQMVLRLARASAALGAGQTRRALDDLAAVEHGLADREVQALLRWPHVPADEVLRAYRLIAAGLRARAHRALGELALAARALETRHALLEERYKHQKLDEHLRALALVEAQLADVAQERKDAPRAGEWLKKAVAHADALAASTKVPIDADLLDLLWMATELRLSTGVKMKLKLTTRLTAAHDKLVAQPDPKWRSHQRLFEPYLGILTAAKPLRAAVDPPK